MPDRRSTLQTLLLHAFCAGLLVLSAGCYSHREYTWPTVLLSGPGWTSYNGQAVWKPNPHVPELAGDVFVAFNTNSGQSFIQFSKTLPFLTAQLNANHWQVNIPSQRQVYSGSGNLPAHFAWLQLPAVLRQQPPSSPWLINGVFNDWQIQNPKTGETLRGYLNAP